MRSSTAVICLAAGAFSTSGCDSGRSDKPELPESCAAFVSQLQSEGKSLPNFENMTELGRSSRSLTCDLDGDGRITGDYIEADLESERDGKGNLVCKLATRISYCPPSALTCGQVSVQLRVIGEKDPCS